MFVPSSGSVKIGKSDICSTGGASGLGCDANGDVIEEDDHYVNWYAEIDFAQSVVNDSLPDDTRVATVIFGGCGKSKPTLETCSGKIETKWGLTEFGSPNDQDLVYERFGQLDGDDFLKGYTWTNTALDYALQEFQANSNDDRKKMIILLTDGEPAPIDVTSEVFGSTVACMTSDGYESDTFVALQDLDVLIVGVAIAVDQTQADEYLLCLLEDTDEHYFSATDFDALSSLVDDISTIVCDDEIELVINEVGFIANVSDSGDDLFFIEIYNPSLGVSLNGFSITGMISYTFEDNSCMTLYLYLSAVFKKVILLRCG